jgi:hypothetical protein
VLYFAVPLVLWLMLRAIEAERLFSRLYLAIVLALIHFPDRRSPARRIWADLAGADRTRRAARGRPRSPRRCSAPYSASPILRSQ